MRAALLPILLLGCATVSGEARADDAPVVIELFTSQGCSSCPPADKILDKLARAGEVGGRKLAPLSFHVDYWDDLGWPDPYASPAWTERQREYAEALGDKRVYTPELVVAGSKGLVGPYYMQVAQAIASAPRQQKLTASATWSKTELTVEATAPAGAAVYVAIWQDGTKTKVPRGENAGETLAADRVVRKLVLVANAGKTEKRTIKLDAAWQAAGAVAFAQKQDRKIIGSALLSKPL
jgi:hypothetical protein